MNGVCFRTDVKDILELRNSVKREADLLEQQLNDLLQAYDDNVKMVTTVFCIINPTSATAMLSCVA